jgi:hypothetical protein
MSVVDHFRKAPEAGFSRSWDAESARRQFNVSLGLIAALAFAAGLLAYSLRIGPAPYSPVASSASVSIAQSDVAPANYGRLVRP